MKFLFKGRIWTIPNMLSGLRLLLIPVFVRLYLGEGDVRAAVVVLLLSGLTDVLDGLIARRFHMVSDFGKALDPLADKLTQLAVLCCLLLRFPRMIWLIVLLCVKELFVASTQIAAIRHTEAVEGADWHGKATAAVLYGTMLTHLLRPDLPEELSFAMELVCMMMLILSGVLYGVRNFRIIRAARAKEKPQPE